MAGSQKSGSPADDLPDNIRKINDWGQRADFSLDGKRILFLEKTYGDVYELELETGKLRPLTHHYYHGGYTRALYLANGDILLSGTLLFDAEHHKDSRRERAELWVLDRSLTKAPVRLGVKCAEGPAVSRTEMRICWSTGYKQYPDTYRDKEFKIHVAKIEYEDGVPKLVGKREVTNNIDNPFFEGNPIGIETQNFIRPDEEKITLALYGYLGGTEASILDLETGEIECITHTPGHHTEPEGIFPDGKFTLLESSRHWGDTLGDKNSVQYIDIWKMPLKAPYEMERVTYFTDYPGYKASNPVVSDDGKYMAFQMARIGDLAGVGRGLFLMELE